MEKNIGLNELIYDYYESRILFGHYKYGDPSINFADLRYLPSWT